MGYDTQGSSEGAYLDYMLYWNNGADFEGSAPAHYEVIDPGLTAGGCNILQVGLGDAERPRVAGEPVGAQIEHRYVDGVLTAEPLWPWPMNERIEAAMVQSGYDQLGGLDGTGQTDLTKVIFELGGGTLPSFD
ncbi:MAG: hypothetical protein JXR96_08530 [Deltaproteobacteria bacterium]|nr:hypothetical protein [Deltaproteobacteria bacterium]